MKLKNQLIEDFSISDSTDLEKVKMHAASFLTIRKNTEKIVRLDTFS